jgi:thiosulfate/3-mercaptopyruvate sulfurtransferase
VRSGRADWERAHLPGSRFADLVVDLSDPDAPYPFTLPSPERFATAVERLGVGDTTLVVAYDSDVGMWAARLSWMLRVGGLRMWTAAGRPLSDASPPPAAVARFTARVRSELVS